MKRLFSPERQLGYRILRWVLFTAFFAGGIIGAVQIYLDAQRVSQELDERANQTLALVREASAQAVYSLDNDLARQVIDGLFAQDQIRYGAIKHNDGTPLAERRRDATPSSYRHITDAIFDSTRRYQVPLMRSAPEPAQYGQLVLEIDTIYAAELWQERAALIMVFGIARAFIIGLVLYLVYYLLVSRPLGSITRALAAVNPAEPGRHLIKTPPGHHRDELDTWVQATNELLLSIADVQQKHQAAQDHISRLSHYDSLTGLPNREMFLHILNNAMKKVHRQRPLLAVFCCGLDDFKAINEQYGYMAGDKLLKDIAARLQSHRVQATMSAGRLGADQFVVTQEHLQGEDEAKATARWLLETISRPVRIDGHELSLTATLGIALFPNDSHEADRLLQQSEQSMTLAKIQGHNHYQFYVASVDQAIRDRKQLERDLEEALPHQQFHLVYQPQIDLQNRRVIGVEALLRWYHPSRGMVPPDEFIPLAESNNTIIEIGYWVLHEACRQARLWLDEGHQLRMSVNLSPVQLRQDNIVPMIMGILASHQLPPHCLELEVTETSFMHNLDDAIGKLSLLRDQGLRIAVDDFGTGYSSLTYLKRLPVHHLKIDKQFIQDLLINEEDTQIANTIIDLGSSLNLQVIAEGVETEEQSVYLAQRGCQLAQGYFFSRPIEPANIPPFLRDFVQTTAQGSELL
ncbi:MAG: bifunctional diguanylate cyclase/phosphodiesterase [Halomonadaceae bacterium]|nr:MAG: bifunctional diguanylate cyclase/phosphodiesterase [Halomonadaceae bacterium]